MRLVHKTQGSNDLNLKNIALKIKSCNVVWSLGANVIINTSVNAGRGGGNLGNAGAKMQETHKELSPSKHKLFHIFLCYCLTK